VVPAAATMACGGAYNQCEADSHQQLYGRRRAAPWSTVRALAESAVLRCLPRLPSAAFEFSTVRRRDTGTLATSLALEVQDSDGRQPQPGGNLTAVHWHD
jgi:hypothetical protein